MDAQILETEVHESRDAIDLAQDFMYSAMTSAKKSEKTLPGTPQPPSALVTASPGLEVNGAKMDAALAGSLPNITPAMDTYSTEPASALSMPSNMMDETLSAEIVMEESMEGNMQDLSHHDNQDAITYMADAVSEDDNDPYASDPNAFNDDDDEEEPAELSLHAQMALQGREESKARRAEAAMRGTFDVDSDSDSSSSEEEDSEDERIPESKLVGFDSNGELIDDESGHGAAQDPSQMGQQDGGGHPVGVEALPDGRIRTQRHPSEELSEIEDEDGQVSDSNSSNDGDDDAPDSHGHLQPQQPSIVPNFTPAEMMDDELSMEDFFEVLEANAPQTQPIVPSTDTLVQPSHPIRPKKRRSHDMNEKITYVPTSKRPRKQAVINAERGTPRNPHVELEEELLGALRKPDQELDSLFEEDEPAAPDVVQALRPPAPKADFFLKAAPPPTWTTPPPMPSSGLLLPSLAGFPAVGASAQSEADAAAPRDAIDLAQDFMFAALASAKLSGNPKDETKSVRCPPTTNGLPSQADRDPEVVMDDAPDLDNGDDKETGVDELKGLKNELHALNGELRSKKFKMTARINLHREIETLKVRIMRAKRGRQLNAQEGEDGIEDEYDTEEEIEAAQETVQTHERVQPPDERARETMRKERTSRRFEERRMHAEKVADEDLAEAVQDEQEHPTQIAKSSRKRAKTAKEYRLRDAEKQRDREDREFFNEDKPGKAKKGAQEDRQKRKQQLFKNRLASNFDENDEVMAKVLKYINPTADSIKQRLEQGDIPGLAEIKATTKQQQLADLMLSIPMDGNEREKRCNKAQLAELNRASKSFGFGRVKGLNGKWLMKGMHTPLYHHQLDGADWMAGREIAKKSPQGGILADSMGLGKTVTTLATILGNPPDAKDIKKKRKATLIVLPASLLGQWEAEIEKHVDSNALSKVQIYKKSSNLKLRVIEDCDIVLTTYSGVMRSHNLKMTAADSEVADKIGPEKWREKHSDQMGVLHQIEWYRIVLDEAHVIKNWKSSTAQACFSLKGKFRWCLTGTPMMNSLDELYSYFKFFQCDWTKDFQEFKGRFGDPNVTDATKRLSVMMPMVMKRRTFGDSMMGRALIDLPKPVSTRKFLKLTREEVVIYRLVEEKFRDKINTHLRAGASGGSYTWILAQLLRARQAASHPFLLESVIKNLFDAGDLVFMKEKFGKLGRSKLPIYDQIKEWIVAPGDKNQALPFGKSNFGHRFDISVFLNTPAMAKSPNACVVCQDMAKVPQVSNCHHFFCKGTSSQGR